MHVIHNGHEAQVMPQVRVPRGWPPLWSCEERLPQLWCIIYMWMICFGGTLPSVAKTVIYGHGMSTDRLAEVWLKRKFGNHVQNSHYSHIFSMLCRHLSILATLGTSYLAHSQWFPHVPAADAYFSLSFSLARHIAVNYIQTLKVIVHDPMFCCFVFCRRF